MGLVRERHEDEESPGALGGLSIDLDRRACPVCRRELDPWQATCPDDGAEAVAVIDLPPVQSPLLPDPARFLADEDDLQD